jgi:antitoxin (DNA-binding transcriptional repressor) of toxin-antitoxin stability system
MPDGSKLPGVEKVPMATFKARMAEYVERIASEGTTFALTKRGKVVAELSRPRAVPPRRRKSIFGSMKGTIKILGDIVSPLDVEWEALRPDAKLDPD